MASARVLSTNELGTIRYQRAAAARRWPIEVRLLPQPNDTEKTIYTLHTECIPVTPFTSTARDELRATLSVPPGALVYEVLRDGKLVSTGGLEVRCPNPPPLMSDVTGSEGRIDETSVKSRDENTDDQESDDQCSSSVDMPGRRRRWSMPAVRRTVSLSGALQLSVVDGGGPDARDRWRVRFQYYELSWMVRHVSVVDAETRVVRAHLMRMGGSGFVGEADLPVGSFRYRFCVVPHESLVAQMVTPTRLGWDDGAMIHAWEFMTWPLIVDVRDLAVAGASPDDTVMRLDFPPDPPLLITTDQEDVDDDDSCRSASSGAISDVIVDDHGNYGMSGNIDDFNDHHTSGVDRDDVNNDDGDADANTEVAGSGSQYELSRTTDEFNEYVASDGDEYSERLPHVTGDSRSSTAVSDNSECPSSISKNHGNARHTNSNYETVSTLDDFHPGLSNDVNCGRTPSAALDPRTGDGVFRTAPTPVVDWSSRLDHNSVGTRVGTDVSGGDRMTAVDHFSHDDISIGIDVDFDIDENHDTSSVETGRHGSAKSRHARSKHRARHSPFAWGAVAVNAAMFALGSTFTFVLGGAARRRSRSDTMSDISVRTTRRRSHSQASTSTSR